MSRWLWLYNRFSRKLGYRATLYCVAGVLAALIAKIIGPYIPEQFSEMIGADAVDAILAIIASSMLAVTTFSLTTMVSAISAASGSATPRATQLVIEDTTAQRALSTFLGAFLFSLVGLIALKTELYNAGGRLVLFAATLGVIALIVFTLLRWIAHLSRLGRLGETIERVEEAACQAMDDYRQKPFLGANSFIELPANVTPVYLEEVGIIEHLDVPTLASLADELHLDIYMMLRPGGFCQPGRPIACVRPRPLEPQNGSASPDVATLDDEDQLAQRIASAITLGTGRTFEQDPRFGLIVLCEIGSRALSTAINDSGTVIDVLSTLVRVMKRGVPRPADADKPLAIDYPHVFLQPLCIEDLFEDAFMPLARDGAGLLEVGIKFQKSMAALAAMHPDFNAPAAAMAQSALDRSMHTLSHEGDRQRLQSVAQSLFTPLPGTHSSHAKTKSDEPTRTMLV